MIRLFYNSTEITKEVERLDTSVFEMSYAPGDYIYVASDFPFNNSNAGKSFIPVS